VSVLCVLKVVWWNILSGVSFVCGIRCVNSEVSECMLCVC
jgi:hypothetical protein